MVDEYVPNKLKGNKFHVVKKTVCEHLRKGHRREQAFIRAGVAPSTMKTWWRKYQEEVDDELEDTVLQRLWEPVLEAEAEAEADIVEVLRNLALDGREKSLMYILDKRYGWAGKQEVELSTGGDGKISIEIVDMTDEHEAEVENNGESRDDQDTAEIHQ